MAEPTVADRAVLKVAEVPGIRLVPSAAARIERDGWRGNKESSSSGIELGDSLYIAHHSYIMRWPSECIHCQNNKRSGGAINQHTFAGWGCRTYVDGGVDIGKFPATECHELVGAAKAVVVQGVARHRGTTGCTNRTECCKIESGGTRTAHLCIIRQARVSELRCNGTNAR